MLKPEEMLTPAQIEAFDVKYGADDYAIIRKPNRRTPTAFDWEVAIRRPDSVEYQLFKARIMKENTAARANELLIKTILIHPTLDALNEYQKKWPGICDSSAVTSAVQELCGLASDELEKP